MVALQEPTQSRVRIPERPINPIAPVLGAAQRWQYRARDGMWMVAVYKCSGRTQADVMQINRAHLNDQLKLRIETAVQRLSSTGTSLMSDEVLDLPVDKLQWYEIMEPLAAHEVEEFKSAMSKAAALRELLNDEEPLTSADAAYRKPR